MYDKGVDVLMVEDDFFQHPWLYKEDHYRVFKMPDMKLPTTVIVGYTEHGKEYTKQYLHMPEIAACIAKELSDV